MFFQHRIFWLQDSAVGICAAIVHITTIQCASYCILGAKYRARTPVYAMSTVVPDIYNVITVTYIQTSKFKWTNMRCYCRYPDISMCVILPTWCQIQRTSSSLRYVNYGPDHIQCNYSSAYSGFNIRQNPSALLLEIIGHVDARYTANLVTNTAHIIRFKLCVLWSRTCTTCFQLLIFRTQYSTERICAAIGNIRTLRSALYCKFGVKCSGHRSVYAV
jgi:hypothetical protein